MKKIWKNAAALLMALILVMTAAPFALADEAPAEAETAEAAETVDTAEAADAAETEETAEAEETVLAEPVLLATVNGQEILSDNKAMQDLIDYYTEFYASYGYDTADPTLQSMLQAVGLEWAVESALYTQKAQELNVPDMTEEQRASMTQTAKAEWDAAVEYYMQAVGNMTDSSTEEEKATARETALAYIETNYGYTEESYISSYLDGMLESQRRENVQNAVLGEIDVTEEEISAHFNEIVEDDKETYENNIPTYEYNTRYMNQPSYYVPEGYRGITHILLDVDDELMNNYKNLSASLEEQDEQATADDSAEATEAPAESAEAPAESAEATAEPVTQEMVDAARQAILDSVKDKVDEINAKYQAGTPFADLIAEYGTDPGMTVEPGKTNGYAVHKESILYDPVFTQGAMALEKVGDISEPLLGTYGVHILHYTRDIPAGAVEMTEEIRSTLKDELQSELEQAAVSAMVADWISQADVQYTEEGQQLKRVLEENNSDSESVEATEATEEVLGDDD